MDKIIRRSSVSQQVIDYILERIEDGSFKAGDKLPGEREFAEELGISRVPLREAVSALAAMGIIEKRQGDGSYISGFSPEVLGRILRTYTALDSSFAAGLFEARALIEASVARLAARNAGEENIAALETAAGNMAAAVPEYAAGEKTLEEMLELDDIFHLQCALASHNQFYIQFVNILHFYGREAGLFENSYGKNPEKYFESLEFHEKILEAIKGKDEENAQKIMLEHIENIRMSVEQDSGC